METNLKNNIWIEGFDSEEQVYDITLIADFDTCIWAGKTSEIPEEIAKKYVQRMSIFTPQFRAYNKTYSDFYCTPKESIQSACDKPYCIIYKKSL